jgi:hypothetical protein
MSKHTEGSDLASEGLADSDLSNPPLSAPTNTDELDEILESVAIKSANQYGGFEEWETPDEKEEVIGEAKRKLAHLIVQKQIEELESVRTEQGGHNLEELCCELCDRIAQLKGDTK